MKIVLQRVSFGEVKIDGEVVGKIDKGILCLVGIGEEDNEADLSLAADKLIHLRIFEDENGRMNKSLLDEDGGLLLVPNFTLYSDISHGRRPYFSGGAPFERAKALFEELVSMLENSEVSLVQKGVFGADMKVSLLNDGPVTIILDTKDLIK